MQAGERLEDMLQLGLVHTWALVLDPKMPMRSIATTSQLNYAILGRIANGVAHDVFQCLRQAIEITVHPAIGG
ncbi:hypothetical protein D9M71_811350 [compost metagenome]